MQSFPSSCSRFPARPATVAPLLLLLGILAPCLLVGCAGSTDGAPSRSSDEARPADSESLSKATFAGGCFWCMEPPFDELEGVAATTSGYTGGEVEDPSYEQVSSGGTGHLEAVQVLYDPKVIGYEKLLEVFWHNVDPTDAGGQFCDRGSQYATAVFVHDSEQRRLAEASKKALEASGRFDHPLVTPIVEAEPFYAAEEYHQDYYKKNPVRYKLYRAGCGRDRRLEQVWGEAAGH